MHLYLAVPLMVDPLREIRFWLDIQGEHTLFLREVIPDLEKSYVEELEKIFQVMAMGREKATELSQRLGGQPYWSLPAVSGELSELVFEAMKASRHLVKLLVGIKSQSLAVTGENRKRLISHMIRESEYFLRILAVIKYCH